MLKPGFTKVDSVIKSSDVRFHPCKMSSTWSRQNIFNSWKQMTCTPHLMKSLQSSFNLAKNCGSFFFDLFDSKARTPTLYVAMVMLSMLPCAGARVLAVVAAVDAVLPCAGARAEACCPEFDAPGMMLTGANGCELTQQLINKQLRNMCPCYIVS